MARLQKKMSKKKMLTLVGIATTAVVIAGAAFIVMGAQRDSGQFEQRIDAECSPLVALAFRGSGEANLTPGEFSNEGTPFRYGSSDLVTNGWEGITLQGLFEEVAHTTYLDDFRADAIPVIAIGPAGNTEPFGYDAIDAITEASSIDSALTFSKSRLLHSAQRGAEAATHVIQDYLQRSEGCPILPKFVAIGYSQGAMAARHTAELNPESVLGVVKIGDPYQQPEGVGVRSTGLMGTGLIRWKADDIQKSQLDAYYGFDIFKSSICHGGDPICEFSPIRSLWKLATGTYGDHMDYYSSKYPEEAKTDAQYIAKLGHEQWLKALAAMEAGEKVNCDAEDHESQTDLLLKAVSLQYAGTPTLFSATAPCLNHENMIFEFDLDGDGIFETSSLDGTVWATFDDEGPRTVGVRVTHRGTGETSTATTTVNVAPKNDSVLEFEPDNDGAVSVSASSTVVRGQRVPVTVSGGTPQEAALFAQGGSTWSTAPITLAASPSDWASGLRVPSAVPAGSYLLTVGFDGDRWASTPLTVLDQEPVRAAPQPPAPPATTPQPPATPTDGTPVDEPQDPVDDPVDEEEDPGMSSSLELFGVPVEQGGDFWLVGSGYSTDSNPRLQVLTMGIDREIFVGADGSLEEAVSVPADAVLGGHSLTVEQDGMIHQFEFTVTASTSQVFEVHLSGGPVEQGQKLSVEGTNFAEDDFAWVEIAAWDVGFEVPTSPDGTFELEVTVPAQTQPGPYILSVSQGAQYQEFNFQVDEAPFIVEMPDGPIAPGGSFTIVGSGFEPGSDVTLNFGELEVDNDFVTTDDEGRFEETYTIPQDTGEGNYTITVESNDVSREYDIEVTD